MIQFKISFILLISSYLLIVSLYFIPSSFLAAVWQMSLFRS